MTTHYTEEFQLTAARRRLGKPWANKTCVTLFQLTAARRRLAQPLGIKPKMAAFQLTAARRRLGSRCRREDDRSHFNSQPREGGWDVDIAKAAVASFQLTAARRRLDNLFAGIGSAYFNSQPREGGWGALNAIRDMFNQFQLTAARRRLGLCRF